jgi:hypothetical protein
MLLQLATLQGCHFTSEMVIIYKLRTAVCTNSAFPNIQLCLAAGVPPPEWGKEREKQKPGPAIAVAQKILLIQFTLVLALHRTAR